ncbi:MAG TPA: BhlA/UviB family holin-like peptide [Eubacteriales bacterium]|jgi:hypothetical protein|nr:BhlA/UviB family holin-like peptide [Clostridia bacterium]HRR89520.1 BhlA/UviB family holin-like peptide [Eubacteriales bacterium]HRU84767.1 BhlA/UviB family holin-like peptide [Eubacteriales bacterium]
MWEKIFEAAAANGIWATMFLGLLIYQLKDSRNRESKYQKVVETLSRNLNIVRDIKEEVEVLGENLTAYLFEGCGIQKSAPDTVKREQSSVS